MCENFDFWRCSLKIFKGTHEWKYAFAFFTWFPDWPGNYATFWIFTCILSARSQASELASNWFSSSSATFASFSRRSCHKRQVCHQIFAVMNQDTKHQQPLRVLSLQISNNILLCYIYIQSLNICIMIFLICCFHLHVIPIYIPWIPICPTVREFGHHSVPAVHPKVSSTMHFYVMELRRHWHGAEEDYIRCIYGVDY